MLPYLGRFLLLTSNLSLFSLVLIHPAVSILPEPWYLNFKILVEFLQLSAKVFMNFYINLFKCFTTFLRKIIFSVTLDGCFWCTDIHWHLLKCTGKMYWTKCKDSGKMQGAMFLIVFIKLKTELQPFKKLLYCCFEVLYPILGKNYHFSRRHYSTSQIVEDLEDLCLSFKTKYLALLLLQVSSL